MQSTPFVPWIVALAGVATAVMGCRDRGAPGSAGAAPSASVSAAAAANPTPSSSTSAGKPASSAASGPVADPQRYAWLADKGRDTPPVHSTLSGTVPTPPGWERVAAPSGSFAAWLRDLPLAPPDTPVKSWRGEEIYAADEEYVKAVVAIDLGKADLQQSADVILRLHAEWQWSLGRRDMTYLAATKDPMSFASFTAGKRVLAQGPHIYWVKQREPNDPQDHGAFRDFLDTVFTWANSTAVRMQSDPVAAADLVPGDFFIQRDKTGHAVVVLDIVSKPSGERLALLGQALTPAMSIHVLRPGRGTAWFSLSPPGPLLTPHTREFAWADLRRLRTEAPPTTP